MLNIKLSENVYLHINAIPLILPSKIYIFQSNSLNSTVLNNFGFDSQIGLKFKL